MTTPAAPRLGPGAGAVGILLAAGAGRRLGMPKGLVRDGDGTPWVAAGVRTLLDGGCSRVVVVVGACAQEVAALVPDLPQVDVVLAADWAQGQGASLRAGLEALTAPAAPGALNTLDALNATAAAPLPHGSADDRVAVVHLVDLPDVSSACVARALSAATGSTALARATFAGRPGHPVVIGRAHWAAAAAARGDVGARSLFAEHDATLVDCTDLATGADVDTAADLARLLDPAPRSPHTEVPT